MWVFVVVAGCLLLVWRLVRFMCCFGMVVFLVLGAWLLDSFGLVVCGDFVFRFALRARLLLLFWVLLC